MSAECRLILVAGLISAAPPVSYAGLLECQGTIVSPGATEQELLDACGEPDSRKGADWTYRIPGSLPQVVTLGNGLIMFIRDADEVDSSGSPMEDHP